MRPFYRKVLIGFCGIGLVGGGAIAYAQTRKNNSSANGNGTDKVHELSGAEFNALQDAKKLERALKNNHLPWTFPRRRESEPELDPFAPADKETRSASKDDMKMVFYRLLGCPYCAKVEAVLRYYGIPYEEVQIDPINGSGLPDARYRLAPQLYLGPLASGEAAVTPGRPTGAADHKDGVYLVDSSSIVTALSAPLGYSKDLKDTRIAATRDWITNRFQSASFVVTNSTVRNAYIAYGYLTPAQYQNIFYRLVGSVALYGLANYKIKPRVLAEPHPFDEAYQKKKADAQPHGDGADSKKGKAAAQDPEAWLQDELAVFLERRAGQSVFHGGSKPDLADVEMYGVTRVVSNHPRLQKLVKEGAFGEWERAMEEVMQARGGNVIKVVG